MQKGIQVTLTSSATAYNVYTLAHAVDTGTPLYCHQITIQPDPSAGAAKVNVGDSAVSATRYGIQLLVGDSFNDSAAFNGIGVDSYYLETDTNTTKVNISIDMI